MERYSFKQVLSLFWEYKKYPLLGSCIGIILSIGLFLLLPKQYKTVSKYSIEKNLFLYDAINTNLYPEILGYHFYKECLEMEVDDGEKIKLYQYLRQFPYIGNTEIDLIEFLDKHIIKNINEKDRTLEISVIMPTPKVSAQLCNIISKKLETFLLNYRLNNKTIFYNNKRYEVELAKIKYYQSLDSLSIYIDNNSNISSPKGKLKLNELSQINEILKTDYFILNDNLFFEYNRMKKPEKLFVNIIPPNVPLKRYSPSLRWLFINLGMYGFIMGLLVVSYKYL